MPLRPHQTDALDAMANHTKGQIIVPTGGGKTMCMIDDTKRVFRTQEICNYRCSSTTHTIGRAIIF